MERLIKILRSRFFLAAFCIVLEFVQLLVVYLLLYEFFIPVTVMGWIFYIGVLLYMINKDEIPEAKMPWLIILCFFPAAGAFIYMLLSSNHTSEKLYRRYERAARELKPYQTRTEQLMELRNLDTDAYLQANYLYYTAHMPCRKSTKVTYYSLGEEFHAALMEELKRAESFIFMEYFIVQEGRMWNPVHEILKEKAKQGVDVYFMYDDFGCMTILPETYYKQLGKEGIHCIPASKFTPVLSHIHNNRDHRKIKKNGKSGGTWICDCNSCG